MGQRGSGRIFNNYELLDVLGQGGMATVYRARKRDSDNYVAVKIMSSALATQQTFVDRFIREAQLIESLNHPHILPLYEYGKYKHFFFLVLRLLEGGNLDDKIGSQPLSFGDVEKYVVQIASALDHAHEQKIIHRDLKPSNILLDEEENAYLMDFGIAKITDQNLTMTGQLVGTPSYMPPEQWRAGQVDRRTDIYALGMMTFEMLTGRPAFVAQTPHQLMYAHLNEQIPFISDLIAGFPRVIDQVLLKATSKDPNQRFSSAGEFAVALAKAFRQRSAIEMLDEATQPTGTYNIGKEAPELAGSTMIVIPPQTEEIAQINSLMEDPTELPQTSNRERVKDILQALESQTLDKPAKSTGKISDILEGAKKPSATDDFLPPISLMEKMLQDLESAPPRSYSHLSIQDLVNAAKKSTQEAPTISDEPSSNEGKSRRQLSGLMNSILKGLETDAEQHRITPRFDSLIHQKHDRGYLGIKTQLVKLQPSMVAENGFTEGLLVIEVEPGSPAEIEGIYIGDIFVKLAGLALNSRDILTNILNSDAVGSTVPTELIRGGQWMEGEIFLSRQR